MDEFTGNSNKGKEIKGVQTTAPDSLPQKKETFWKRAMGAIFSEDAKSISEFWSRDVVIPHIKDFLYESITRAASVAIYGGYSKRAAEISKRNSSTDYHGVSSQKQKQTVITRTTSLDTTDYPFGTDMNAERKAEEVFDKITECMRDYAVVKFSDFVEFYGRTPEPTLFDYGWIDISAMKIERHGGNWVLVLPKPMPLDETK